MTNGKALLLPKLEAHILGEEECLINKSKERKVWGFGYTYFQLDREL